MSPLNDPLGYDKDRADEWTPERGICRGAICALCGAVAIGLGLSLLAWYIPNFVTILWMRIPITFGIVWLIYQITQWGSGMGGPHCAWFALALGLVVLAANHVIFAINGVPFSEQDADWWLIPLSVIAQVVPEQGGDLIGWQWCHPYALLTLNAVPMIVGGGFAIAYARHG